MPAVRISTQFTLSVALCVFALGALWLTAVPDTLGPSTYVSIAALLTALAAITMKTGAGDSLANLIRVTENAGTATPRTD